MPVSTSPVPAVASAALPVGLTVTSPVGDAITVGAPFNTTVAPQRCAQPRAASIRRASSSAGDWPVRRCISPRCGVSTRGAGASRSAGTSTLSAGASALSASASRTSGRSRWAVSSRTRCAACGRLERPLPIATASARDASSRMRASAVAVSVR